MSYLSKFPPLPEMHTFAQGGSVRPTDKRPSISFLEGIKSNKGSLCGGQSDYAIYHDGLMHCTARVVRPQLLSTAIMMSDAMVPRGDFTPFHSLCVSKTEP